MSKKLYVGNLLLTLTQEQLSEAFAQWGPVHSAVIITDHATGQSRGFGFVELPDDKAGDAVARMNRTDLCGRPLVVNEARPRESRTGGPGAPGPYGRPDRADADDNRRSDRPGLGLRGRDDRPVTGNPHSAERTGEVEEEWPEVRNRGGASSRPAEWRDDSRPAGGPTDRDARPRPVRSQVDAKPARERERERARREPARKERLPKKEREPKHRYGPDNGTDEEDWD
jgi:RNA recognition motif-containing protein